MVAEIPITNSSLVALVDEVDADRIIEAGPWHLTKGYARHTLYLGGGRVAPKFTYLSMQHLIMGVDNSTVIDHIDRNRLNNCRSNLRLSTAATNNQNVPRRTGQFRGVCYAADRKKWRASARLNGKLHNLGQYETEEEAGEVAAEWRREHMPYSGEEI